jgi:site-specific DNA-cytosine methylase
MVPTLTKVWARFLPIYFPSEEESRPLLNVREFIPDKYYGNGYIRKASIKEVMKLQGFPPSIIPHGKNSIAYEHAGNAVNAKVVEKIAEILLGHIKR